MPKPANLRPAYLRWAEGRPGEQVPAFYGMNLTTATPDEGSWNGSVLPPETQHYVYTILAGSSRVQRTYVSSIGRPCSSRSVERR